MKSKVQYIELDPRAQSSFTGDKAWRNEAYRTWRCLCGYPKLDVRGSINVVVQNAKRNMVVDFVFGFDGFGIAAVNLIEQLDRAHFLSLFDIGTVRDKSGKISDKFVTFHAKHGFVYVRGGERSPRRLCQECGRLIYLAVDDAYLCGLDRKDAMLQSSFGNLLIRSDLFESTLQNVKLRAVKLRRLEVRESSSDGLPVSIEDVVRILRKNGQKSA